MAEEKKNNHFNLLAIHAGQESDSVTDSGVVPIYQTTSDSFTNADYAAGLFALQEFGSVCKLLMNPTTDAFERCNAALKDSAAGAGGV